MRARLAVAASGQRCRLREVVLRDKPAAMLQASPKGTVPVLVLPDGAVIDESLDIMLWALGKADPENWLSPDHATRADMLALIAESDGPFKSALDRYKYPNRYGLTDGAPARDQAMPFLQRLDARLRPGRYLFGARPTLADMAMFPFIRQFANTDRTWFDAQPLPQLQAWLAGHLDSDRFHAIMKKYSRWQPGETEPIFPPQLQDTAQA